MRNAAIKVAAGRYLAFLDSDDLWAPAKLTRQLQALDAHPTRGWSYTGCDRIDEDGRPLPGARQADGDWPDGFVLEPLLTLDLCIAMPTVVAERQLVLQAGRFDEQQRFGEFHDFCVRLALRSPVVAVRELLCSVRSHQDHYSADRAAAYESWDKLYEKMAELAPDDRVRARCRRLRADASLVLAGLRGGQGNHRAAWAALARASLTSWRFPEWWVGALRQLARPVVPRAVLSAYRRRAGAGKA